MNTYTANVWCLQQSIYCVFLQYNTSANILYYYKINKNHNKLLMITKWNKNIWSKNGEKNYLFSHRYVMEGIEGTVMQGGREIWERKLLFCHLFVRG